MDIGGINRIRNAMATVATDTRNKTQNSPERDASGREGYNPPEKPKHLTPEQEDEAIRSLNALPSFIQSGLKAELVREEGKVPHVTVRDRDGKVVRSMPYDQIVDLYLNRKSENGTGRLINRAA